ncbi:MAG: 3-dehydroquinate synthase [Muribaculaceae bacterium]|nr:3-dehydroquinate synthase [Muribaculaceae bacterium]
MNLIFTHHPADSLNTLLKEAGRPHAMILADSHTLSACVEPLREACPALADAPVITVEAGDVNKNLDSLRHIWEQMQQLGATRRSLLVNVGGGMITDMGGFAAATFKRGIRFYNVPTTLLSAVDAAVGGKTGINFGGLKNEIGAFCDADAVVISTSWLATLPAEELKSGYAEMIKHALIDSPAEYRRLLDFDIAHTAGHAFESLAMRRGRPVPHGYAVAWGLVVDLIISHMKLGFPSAAVHELAAYVGRVYGVMPITCDDYPALLELMSHDKKNATPGAINFTLLDAPGKIHIDCIVDARDIEAALDIFRDLMGI